jgi:hypothetical protein
VAAARERDAEQPAAFPFTEQDLADLLNKRRGVEIATTSLQTCERVVYVLLTGVDDPTGYVLLTDQDGKPRRFPNLEEVANLVVRHRIRNFHLHLPRESAPAAKDGGPRSRDRTAEPYRGPNKKTE